MSSLFRIQSESVCALNRLGDALVPYCISAIRHGQMTDNSFNIDNNSNLVNENIDIHVNNNIDKNLNNNNNNNNKDMYSNSLKFEQQYSKICAISQSQPMYAAALSLLAAEYPIQTSTNDLAILDLMDKSLRPLRDNYRSGKLLYSRLICYRSLNFEIKKIPQAKTKVHVKSAEAIRAYVNKCGNAKQAEEMSRYLRHAFDDGVANIFVFAGCANKILGSASLEIAVRAYLDVEGAKDLTNALKSLGWNSTACGALLTEMLCLQGRGVGDLNMDKEIQRRVDLAKSDKLADVNLDILRSSVKYIYSKELTESVKVDDIENWFSKRWAWCVNGSHGNALGIHEPKFAVSLPGYHRIHRRVYSEMLERETVTNWNGHVYVSPSVKLDPGKRRALFACDTHSYFAFEHLLRPVERMWNNHSVILDPGAGGHAGITQRISKLSEGAAINLMADYDDFNSQHTIAAQKIVIEELCSHIGYETALANKLVSSFDNMYICTQNAKLHVTSTLMSGHRATSFLNSVLNKAYFLTTVSDFSEVKSVHVGDDVYIAAPSARYAYIIIKSISLYCHLNRLKQSIGTISFEFLRMATHGRHTYGYLSRAVVSAVGGNWVTTHEGKMMDKLNTFYSNAWTLANRSCDDTAGLMLLPSCVKVTGLDQNIVRHLLLGNIAINDGPSRGMVNSRLQLRPYVTPYIKASTLTEMFIKSVPKKATQAYMAKHISELERKAALLIEINVMNLMVDSSYNKTVSEANTFVNTKQQLHSGSIDESFLLLPIELSTALKNRHERKSGELEKYTLLQLMKPNLTNRHLCELLSDIGVEPGSNPREVAWGESSGGCHAVGIISYSDMCLSAGGSGKSNAIYSSHYYHV